MTDNQQPAVVVKDIIKTFKLPHDQHSGLKQLLVNFNKRKKGYELQEVLKGLSFEINKGDFFGIVGRNGSGKSTLLKLLAGIYAPDSGLVQVNGSLTPFIELGVGFNPELTGRENVFLNGALLGFSRKEMEVMYDDIVSFAELEKFMDQRLKNYSSGMQVRLAFSIAIRADSDILLLDEVLAVGDEAFQRKCFSYFAQLKKAKKTVILVTHSMDAVQQFCTKAIMIEKGEIIESGNPAKVAQTYREMFIKPSNKNYDKNIITAEQPVDMTASVRDKEKTILINLDLLPKMDIDDAIVSIFIDRDTGEQVYRFSTDERTGELISFKNKKMISINLALQNIFPNGVFTIRASVKDQARTTEYALSGNLAEFEIDRRLETGSEWDIHWNPTEEYSINSQSR